MWLVFLTVSLKLQTLASINHLPVANIWPAALQTWPAGTGPGINEVMTTAMSIVSHFINTDATVSFYEYSCTAIPAGQERRPLKPTDMVVSVQNRGSLFM